MRKLFTVLILFVALSAGAATRYMSPSGSCTAPYDTWAKAATGIVPAVIGATDGDTILISNGVYAYVNSLYTNVTWTSVNGPSTVTFDGTKANLPEIFQGQFYGITFANVTGQYGVIFEGTHTISNCVFTRNRNTRDNCGAVTFYAKTKTIIDCNFYDNSSQYEGGGLALAEIVCTAILLRCSFSNNVATQNGGAINNWGGYLFADNCTFAHNQSAAYGGAIASWDNAASVISNSVIKYNGAADGGAITKGTLVNCLVYGNTAGLLGASYGGELANCTVVGNCGTNANYGAVYGEAGEKRNLIAYYNFPADISRGFYTASCFRATSKSEQPMVGAGCLSNIAPEFVDAAYYDAMVLAATNTGLDFVLGPHGEDGLKLAAGSPCIDTGTNQVWMATAYDYSRTNARIIGASVDMGAYEYLAGAAAAVPEDYSARALLLWRMMQ